MGRIKAFRFKWSDAWRDVSDGYDSILEISEKGDVRLLFMVNSQPYEVDLTGKENEFISELDFLKNWNKKTYIDEWCLDGFNWEIFLHTTTQQFTQTATTAIRRISQTF